MASSKQMMYASFSRCSLQLSFLFSLLLHSPLISAFENQFKFKLDGKILELNDSNFDAAITNFDYILVDFYAPWCGHCKRLAPELEKAAPILAGLKLQPIVVAKVDADKHRKLASKHDVNAYPTLKLFMHGVPTEYHGPRKAELLVRFLSKFVAPDVSLLNSNSAIRDFIEAAAGSNYPIFVGFGLTESMILNLAVKYKIKAWFCVAKDFSDETITTYDLDKVPALAAIHPVYNQQSIFYGPFEEKLLEDYITQSFLPLVLPINQDSLRTLKDDQRRVLLTILEDETDQKSERLLEVLRAAASANHDLIFGYVGFKQWEKFAGLFEVHKKTKLAKMVVWDGNEVYCSVIGSESIDETDMEIKVSRFLEGYREGSIIQKRITGPTLMGFMSSHLPIILVFVLIFVVLLVAATLWMTKEEPQTVKED